MLITARREPRALGALVAALARYLHLHLQLHLPLSLHRHLHLHLALYKYPDGNLHRHLIRSGHLPAFLNLVTGLGDCEDLCRCKVNTVKSLDTLCPI